MRIGLVTTWGQACGISTYSEQLAHELSSDVVVFAPSMETEGGVGLSGRLALQSRNIPYHACWRREGGNNALLQYAVQSQVDIVHFQHEDGLFWDSEDFVQVLRDMRRSGIGTVVTLHTVRDSGGAAHTGFYTRLREHADAIIVHSTSGRAALLAVPGRAPVVQVPHGTPDGRLGDPEVGCKQIGLPVHKWRSIKVWGISLGFIGPNKNIAGTLRTFAEVHARRLAPEGGFGFIVAGDVGTGAEAYLQHVFHSVNEAGIRDRVVLYRGFIPADKVADVLCLAKFGVLNSISKPIYSASGQVHLFAAHGMPLMVANRPIYSDAVHAGAAAFEVGPSAEDHPTLSAINCMAAMARSTMFRAAIGRKMEGLAQSTEWSKVAAMHDKLYKELMDAKSEGNS